MIACGKCIPSIKCIISVHINNGQHSQGSFQTRHAVWKFDLVFMLSVLSAYIEVSPFCLSLPPDRGHCVCTDHNTLPQHSAAANFASSGSEFHQKASEIKETIHVLGKGVGPPHSSNTRALTSKFQLHLHRTTTMWALGQTVSMGVCGGLHNSTCCADQKAIKHTETSKAAVMKLSSWPS